MANILNVNDIVNSIKKIEKDCERVDGFGKLPDPDYKKFYERVKGLIALAENLEPKPGSGPGGIYG
jgi:hypothetical protein